MLARLSGIVNGIVRLNVRALVRIVPFYLGGTGADLAQALNLQPEKGGK
jgi:hypothetical protein